MNLYRVDVDIELTVMMANEDEPTPYEISAAAIQEAENDDGWAWSARIEHVTKYDRLPARLRDSRPYGGNGDKSCLRVLEEYTPTYPPIGIQQEMFPDDQQGSKGVD